jgi:hypothetical protein
MVSITLRNKAEIQKQLDLMIDQVVNMELDQACVTAYNLDKAIVKYYVSRNLEYKRVRDIIIEMIWTFNHFGNYHGSRVEKFFEQLVELYKAFEYADGEQSLKDRILRIYTDLKEDFLSLCSTGNPGDMVALSDDFRALQNLASEMSPLGENIYNKYIQVMRSVGLCQASLPKLVSQSFEKGRWRVRHEAIGSLTNDFSQLYPLIESLILSFSEPVLVGKNVESDVSVDRDLEKDLEDARASKCYNLLIGKNMSISRIAELEGLEIVEVIDLLGLSRNKE